MNQEPGAMELPQYICHKKVHALQIRQVVWLHEGEMGKAEATLHFVRTEYASIHLTPKQLMNKPVPKDGNYYIVYKDGYFSFSPAKEFEDGYTLASELQESGRDIPTKR